MTNSARRVTVVTRVRPLVVRRDPPVLHGHGVVGRQAENTVGTVVSADGSEGSEFCAVKLVDPTGHQPFPRVFPVDLCFEPGETNAELYDALVADVVTSNVRNNTADTMCLIAYGHTNSGKTHTIVGWEGDEGLLPRVARAMLEACDGVALPCVDVTMVEVYSERCYDLLANGVERRVRRLGGGSSGGGTSGSGSVGSRIVVEGITRVSCGAMEEFEDVCAFGAAQRRTAATDHNSRSSRSHAIVTLKCRQFSLCLVDLAGSERQALFSPTLTKESVAINKSLSRLSTVLEGLSRTAPATSASAGTPSAAAAFVNFRDTLLTVLLQRYLGGAAAATFIACVHPHPDFFAETLSTMRYTQRLKRIRTAGPPPPPPPRVAALQCEVEELRMALGRHAAAHTAQRRRIEQLEAAAHASAAVGGLSLAASTALLSLNAGGEATAVAAAAATAAAAASASAAGAAVDQARRIARWVASASGAGGGVAPSLHVRSDFAFDDYFHGFDVVGYLSAVSVLPDPLCPAGGGETLVLDVADAAVALAILGHGVPPGVRLHTSACSLLGCDVDMWSDGPVAVFLVFEAAPGVRLAPSSAAAACSSMVMAPGCAGGHHRVVGESFDDAWRSASARSSPTDGGASTYASTTASSVAAAAAAGYHRSVTECGLGRSTTHSTPTAVGSNDGDGGGSGIAGAASDASNVTNPALWPSGCPCGRVTCSEILVPYAAVFAVHPSADDRLRAAVVDHLVAFERTRRVPSSFGSGAINDASTSFGQAAVDVPPMPAWAQEAIAGDDVDTSPFRASGDPRTSRHESVPTAGSARTFGGNGGAGLATPSPWKQRVPGGRSDAVDDEAAAAVLLRLAAGGASDGPQRADEDVQQRPLASRSPAGVHRVWTSTEDVCTPPLGAKQGARTVPLFPFLLEAVAGSGESPPAESTPPPRRRQLSPPKATMSVALSLSSLSDDGGVAASGKLQKSDTDDDDDDSGAALLPTGAVPLLHTGLLPHATERADEAASMAPVCVGAPGGAVGSDSIMEVSAMSAATPNRTPARAFPPAESPLPVAEMPSREATPTPVSLTPPPPRRAPPPPTLTPCSPALPKQPMNDVAAFNVTSVDDFPCLGDDCSASPVCLPTPPRALFQRLPLQPVPANRGGNGADCKKFAADPQFSRAIAPSSVLVEITNVNATPSTPTARPMQCSTNPLPEPRQSFGFTARPTSSPVCVTGSPSVFQHPQRDLGRPPLPTPVAPKPKGASAVRPLDPKTATLDAVAASSAVVPKRSRQGNEKRSQKAAVASQQNDDCRAPSCHCCAM